jgi:uncharacterized protein (DUF2141 family)
MKLVGILLLLLLLPVLVQGGKGHGIEVRGTLPLLVDIEPGKIVSGSFLVTNTGSSADLFIEELQLPPGWHKIVPQDGHFPLEAGEQQARLVAFAVPAHALEGDYTITYAVKSRGDVGIFDGESITVRVLPVRKLALVLRKKPEMVVAGQTFLVEFQLLNLGNGTNRVKLEIKNSEGFPVDPDHPRVTLEAGESRALLVMVKTDDKLKVQQRCLITILAAADGGDPGEKPVTLTTMVEVLPRSPEVDLLRRLTSRLRLVAVQEGGRYGMQAELAGFGVIDEAGKRSIDFLIRSPDIQEKNLYGQRDEYHLNFYGEHFDLLLGDQSYSLSPLTERWKYGRGGGARFHYPKLGGGAFYLESRWQEPKASEVGSYLSYQFTDWFSLKGNFLTKKKEADATDSARTTNLYSLETAVQLGREHNLELEFGISDEKGEIRTRDHAYRADLRGRAAGFRYAFEKTYAGSRYFGYYHDMESMHGSISFPVYQKMTGHVSYRSYQNNLDLDPAGGRATEEVSYRAGVTRPFSFGTTLSLNIEDFRKEDRMPTPQFDFQGTFLTAGIGHTFKKASLQIYLDRGLIDNHHTGTDDRTLENYSFFASIFPTPGQRYSFFGRFGHDKYSEHPERTKSAGMSADWLLHRLRVGLNYQVNNFDSAPSKMTSTLTSTLDYNLPNHHTINLRNRWSIRQTGGEDDLALFLAYTIPLGIPVGKKTSVGVITGKVYAAEKGGNPMPNVLVNMAGFAAITDHTGTFTLSALKPGTYYLTVENGSIGQDLVTTEKMPLAVEVKGGERTRIEIRLTKAGRISGELTLLSPTGKGDDNLALVGLAGSAGQENQVRFGNNLVEVTRDDEFFRQMTDADGKFSFAGLRPGNWVVKVYKDNLPLYHYLEKERFVIEVHGSEEKVIAVKVVPRIRKIQMVHMETSISSPVMPSPMVTGPPVSSPMPVTGSPPAVQPAAQVTRTPAEAPKTAKRALSTAVAPVLPTADRNYFIHAGSYLLVSDRLHTEKIVRRLGFEPELTPERREVEMVRLLIGVFSAKEARERLRELAEEAASAFILPMGNRAAVYAGSYYSIDEARDFSARLARRGIRAQEEPAQVMMSLKRVIFGSFNNQEAAEDVAFRARAAGLEALVMRER